MRPRTVLIPLCVLSILGLSLMDAGWADGVDTQDVTIDVYAMNMEQSVNNTAFDITERMYFNNSGSSPFNGSLFSWLPPEATLNSSVCANKSTTVVRVVNSTDLRCYPFSRLESDEEIIAFAPFEDDEMLSYFGQNATLHLNASNENSSSWHSIPVNITVGMGNETRSSTEPGRGMAITADQERMGARLYSESVIPEYIMANQTINITNEEFWNQTISFSVVGLPTGWTAHIYDNGSEINNVTLQPNETKTLELVVGVPSYKTIVEIPYRLSLEASGAIKRSVIFEQSFLYSITEYSLWLFANEETVVYPPESYYHWEHGQDGVDFHVIVGSPLAGESLQIIIEWGAESEGLPLWVIAAIALLIAAAIALVIFWARRGKKPEEAGEEVAEAPVEIEDIEPSEARKEEILAALKEAERAFAAGHLSEDFYKDIKSKYESELEEIEEAREDPEILALEKEKRKLLGAIRELQKKQESGGISEDVRERLMRDYKKRAIEIMKILDQRKK
ncbi:MAG: hypothetical protein ACE5IJ_05420 [Thermoplasmata archaeon]